MPSPIVERLLNSMSEEVYDLQVERFEREIAPSTTMTFEEFLEEVALSRRLAEIRDGDIGRERRADCAANGVGYVDSTGSHMPSLRKARDPYASVSPYQHGDRRGIATSNYETSSGDTSFSRGSHGHRPEGRRQRHGAPTRTPPEAFNPYGPAQTHLRYSNDDPADFGGRGSHYHGGDPAPHRLDAVAVDGRAPAQSSFAEASSRNYERPPDTRPQGRDGSYSDGYSFRDSSGQYGGRRDRTGDRHR